MPGNSGRTSCNDTCLPRCYCLHRCCRRRWPRTSAVRLRKAGNRAVARPLHPRQGGKEHAALPGGIRALRGCARPFRCQELEIRCFTARQKSIIGFTRVEITGPQPVSSDDSGGQKPFAIEHAALERLPAILEAATEADRKAFPTVKEVVLQRRGHWSTKTPGPLRMLIRAVSAEGTWCC